MPNVSESNISYSVLGKATPTLISLRLGVPEIRILVTGPQMLYSGLRMLTSLSLVDGCYYETLSAFADAIEADARCGGHGIVQIPVEVKSRRTSSVLEIGVGPMSIYQSELRIRTLDGSSFDKLIRTHLVGKDDTDYIAALEPLPILGRAHASHAPCAGSEHEAHMEHEDAHS